MKVPVSIAIDGPAGAGKSTLAKKLADRLGFLYIDTGALYRTVGLHAMRSAGGYSDPAAVTASLSSCSISMEIEKGRQVIRLNGEPVGANIRTPEASMAASAVSAIPEVRAFLLKLQRGTAEKYSVVMDGRDIGTVILPDARIKIFLTAAPEVRARRRCDELEAEGGKVSYEEVLADLLKRDSDDSSRAVSPLRAAPDAVTLDTTELSFDASFDALYEIVKSRLPKRKKLHRHIKTYPIGPFAVLQWLLRPLLKMLFRIKVTGREKLPAGGKLILCCNHLSFLDPVALAAAFNRPISFIAKKQLFGHFGLHGILCMLGAVPINRDAPDREVFRATGLILERGHVIGIYPEGTRSKSRELLEGKPGVGMLVARGGAPVLPCAIWYPKGAGLFRPTYISFGDIIPEDELITGTGKNSYKACAELIMERISALREPLCRK